MKLRTRLLFLFLSTMVVMAVLVMAHYIQQSLLLEYFDHSLEHLKLQRPPQWLSSVDTGLSSDMSGGIDTASEMSLTLWYDRVQFIASDFNYYRSRVYLQAVISAVIVMVLFALGMSSLKKNVLARLNILRSFLTDAYQHGLAFRRLHLGGNDELTQFAKLFNASVDAIESHDQRYTGKLVEDRRLLATLIALSKPPRAFFRSNGDFLGSNLSEEIEHSVKVVVRDHLDEIQKLIILDAQYPLEDAGPEAKVRVEYVGPGSGTRLLISATPTEDEGGESS